MAGTGTVLAGLGLITFLAVLLTLAGWPPPVPRPAPGLVAGTVLLELFWQADLRPRAAWNSAGVVVLAPFGYPRAVCWREVRAVAVNHGTVRILTSYHDIVRFDFLPGRPRLHRRPGRAAPRRSSWFPPAPWRGWPPAREPVRPPGRTGRVGERTRLIRAGLASARAAAELPPAYGTGTAGTSVRPPELGRPARPWWAYAALGGAVLTTSLLA